MGYLAAFILGALVATIVYSTMTVERRNGIIGYFDLQSRRRV